MRVGVFRHAHHRRPRRPRTCVEGVKLRIRKRRHDFARAISAEIQAEDPIPVLHAGVALQHRGRDKFIVFVQTIGIIHRIAGGWGGTAFALHDRLISFGNAVPAVVTVHREITPRDGRDTRPVGQGGLQRLEIAQGRARRDIAPVGQRMDNYRNTLRPQRTHRGNHMRQVPMHPAIRDKPHHMRRAAGLFQRLDKVQQRLMGGKRAFLDRKIDLAQIHRDDTTSPDIGMPHLGVAHLPLWKTHIRPEGGQRR